MSMRVLVIMQGPPGSGKSCMAKHIRVGISQDKAFEEAVICSTDDYFECPVSHVYTFRPELLKEHHQSNQDRVRCYLERGDSVIVDNSCIKRWEARPYVEMAHELGIPVVFVRCTGQWANVHGVPPEKVESMRAAMEELTVEGCRVALPPFPPMGAPQS